MASAGSQDRPDSQSVKDVDRAILSSDLAHLKLEQGDVSGAEALFRDAVAAREKAEGSAVVDDWEDADSEDWETQFDDGRLPGVQEPEVKKEKQPPPARAPVAQPDDVPKPAAICYDHVLEAFDLKAGTSVTAIEAYLRTFDIQPVLPAVRTVSDHCAVVLFPNAESATKVLRLSSTDPFAFHFRPFDQASKATRQLPASELLPAKPRPKATAAVARRMIISQLNIGENKKEASAHKAELQDINAQRQQKVEEKKKKQHGLDAAWDEFCAQQR